MIRRNILGIAFAAVMLSGSVLANGHGTHTAGTIGATGNNTASSGGYGRDVLVGGTGADRSGGVPTGTVTFFDSTIGGVLFVVQTIMTIR